MQQFAALLRTKLTGKRYRLLYTWSRDGRSNASFHQRCDNQVRDRKRFFGSFADAAGQGPTLIIVRSTNGFTFGGYAAAAWNNGAATNIPAAGSFVFWVENPQGRAPGCLDCVTPASALHSGNISQIGPIFHCGNCLYLCTGNNPECSCAQPTAGYPDTTGLGAALFTGAAKFTTEDYEVWAAT